MGPLTDLDGSAAVLAWYGPYDAHDPNSMAIASVTKIEQGVPRFAFECVFIGVCLRTATEAPHEHSVEIQLRIVGVGIWETNWTLVL